MLLPLRAATFGLITLLAWHGAGVPLERADEACRCEEAGVVGATSSVGDQGEEGAENAHETCPPDCDGCFCCGGAWMLATLSTAMVNGVPVRAAAQVRSMERGAPTGEPRGVFRPPRA